jgi:nuclear pore complex protein Nup133
MVLLTDDVLPYQTVLKAAFDYRDYNLGVYGIELPMLNPWTSKNSMVEIVMGLFDITTNLVESPSTDSNAVRMSSEPNMQLPELASILFSCIHERLEWLGRFVFLSPR